MVVQLKKNIGPCDVGTIYVPSVHFSFWRNKRRGTLWFCVADLYYDDYYGYEEDYYYGAYAPPPPPMHRGRGRGGPYSPPVSL